MIETPHWCKVCRTHFAVDVEGTADVFLVCPTCERRHYRRFERGVAVHCEIGLCGSKPREVTGRRLSEIEALMMQCSLEERTASTTATGGRLATEFPGISEP